ncbi:MAG: DUF6288 domain-containing protein [Planctomycetota bacterium]|nr:DUF6288 domain-containing protein [Planctomycetota bacterium]
MRSGLASIACLAGVLAALAPAQRQKPPVPDLTAGGRPDGKHDWNLGPTGARGWMWGWKHATTDARQILVTQVAADSPAEGRLREGDVLLGLDSARFDGDPRIQLGDAIARAEAGDGKLTLLRWRDGQEEPVTVELRRLGAYADTAPFDCKKSAAILDAACEHIARNMKGDIDGMVNALALLAAGKKEHLPSVRRLALEVGSPSVRPTLANQTTGSAAWMWGYRTLFLTEYFLATRDASVKKAITAYAQKIAEGQSGVGTWGHGMAWPDLNEGRLHGSLGGYGALNQAGIICHLALVLTRRCGIDSEEITAAIDRANRFFRFYAEKGAIPYGDHRPGWDMHDDNGKNSVAAVLFDLQGDEEAARFFARMTVASYGERELGHTGNYFSLLWGPLGALRAGPDAAAAFLREQRWYYDLARAHDGSFPYQGGAGMDGAEHKYGNWDCTGAFVLAMTLPQRRLAITGRDAPACKPLTEAELEDAVAAGRGFHTWDRGKEQFDAASDRELLQLLSGWSPAVRNRAAETIARRPQFDLAPVLRLLGSKSREARYGACEAIAAVGDRARSSVPTLTRLLENDDVWLRIQAALALAAIGDAARSAAPAMLRLALRDDPADPRQFTQRYLCFALFYKGGALGMRGLLARSLDGIDRDLLRDAVTRLLQNDDGRARSALESVYRNLTLDEISPLLPAIVGAIETPAPSGVMFASGIRLSGLDLLARHRIAEGMELCLDVMDIELWGKKDRITGCLKTLASYGGAAKPVLPRLRELERALTGHREARSLSEQIELCRRTLSAIESDGEGPPLRTVTDLVRPKRRESP